MKQKMSRISGVGCVAAAFANGPDAGLCSGEPCYLQNLFKNLKKTLAFFRKPYYTMQVLLLWLIGQAVKTSPSHGESRGSIPLSAAL